MPKTKAQKAVIVTDIADRLARMSGAVLADFSGLKMPEFDELRTACRAAACEYTVMKKSLFRRAASEQGIAVDESLLPGGASMLVGFVDPVAPAKLVKQFGKAHPALKVLGGILREGASARTLTAAEIAVLGDLPSANELRARVVGSLASPLRGLVGVLQGNIRKLVYVLQAIAQQ